MGDIWLRFPEDVWWGFTSLFACVIAVAIWMVLGGIYNLGLWLTRKVRRRG